MTTRASFQDLLAAQADQGKFLCVGLDLDVNRIPANFLPEGSVAKRVARYGQTLVAFTQHCAAAYKLNIAFYLSQGSEGIRAFENLVTFIKERVPEAVIIADQKANDIGTTSDQYAKAYFETFGVDALTLNPYMGQESLVPFLKYADKGCIVICKTSNPGSAEFQNRNVALWSEELHDWPTSTAPLYQLIASQVNQDWNSAKNCGLVVGATYPDEMAKVRAIAGDDVLILAPGVGKQGGDLEATVKSAKNSQGRGFLINVSSDIAFAQTRANQLFSAAAQEKAEGYHAAIRAALE